MITDRLPRKAEYKDEYARSEAMVDMDLPPADSLRQLSRDLEQAMKNEDRKLIEKICKAIAVEISVFFCVAPPTVRVLGVRPRQESGDSIEETFADYTFETATIRLWMRTAVLE